MRLERADYIILGTENARILACGDPGHFFPAVDQQLESALIDGLQMCTAPAITQTSWPDDASSTAIRPPMAPAP